MLDWRFIIPLLWALVSAALALLLYKTSNGLFEQVSSDREQTRRIRLVGSIVLAAAIFVALKWATPEAIVTGQLRGSAIIPKSKLHSSAGAMQGLRNSFDRLEACASISTMQDCRSEIDSVRSSITSLESALPRAD